MNTPEVMLRQLSRRGIHGVVSGGEIRIHCPFCMLRGKSKDDQLSCSINYRRGMGYCFRCHWKSRKALEELKVANVVGGVAIEDPVTDVPVVLPEDFEPLHSKGDEWMQKAWQYAMGRGLSEEQVHRHQVGLSLIGRSRARVVFPIYRKKQLLGFSGRTLVDAEPKWLHSPGLRSVYPARYGFNKTTVIIVEGIVDALVVERWVPGADVLALLGTHLSEQKMQWLDSYSNIVLWLDPDLPGRKATVTIAPQLEDYGKRVMVVQSEKDPADLTEQEIHAALSKWQRWSATSDNRLLFSDPVK